MAKGGTYENTIIRKLTTAFACIGIHEDDCYRTRNSGASAKQPGDIQLSPRFGKLFKATIECKHYKIVKYQLGKPLHTQDPSFRLFAWWKQVEKEQQQAKKIKGLTRQGILVFRQNHCPDLVAMTIASFEFFCGNLPNWQKITWVMFTSWHSKKIIIMHLDEFLPKVIRNIQRKKK